ncbi:GAF domain-containing protein [Spirosoma oryzicola]|uniref:GAF domain-containing protein n=1 Tax=Spirosoma oryzicola TaxID=2898794 RepID=UPI001E5D33C6|nr:GAF domain-containing protein [Spirosoma oryzicola]UHG94953.1 GAF domain-containing protein [Spirosoma oryzicola]
MELVFDQTGRIADMICREANAALATHIGYSVTSGTLLSEFISHIEPYWHDSLLRVHQTGVAERVEGYNADRGRWFSVQYSRVGEAGHNLIAAVFQDITDRKREEQRQDYLLKLSDALRTTADPVAIEAAVSRLTMDYFGVDRCYYCTIEGDNAVIRRDAFRGNLPSVAASYPWSNFPLFKKIVEEGKPLIVDDAPTSAILDEALRTLCIQLQVISFLDVPVVKGGNVAGVLCIVQSTPRPWTPADVQLASDWSHYLV